MNCARKPFVSKTSTTVTNAHCSFLQMDTSTSGSWPDKYGHGGFILPRYYYGRDLKVTPDYISRLSYGNMTAHQFSTFNTSTTASLNPNPLNYDKRYLGCVESSSADSIELYVNDTISHRIAIYFCDFDKKERKQDIEIVNFMGHPIAEKQELSHFENGKWLLYRFSGSVRIKITNRNERTTAVLSALMFDN